MKKSLFSSLLAIAATSIDAAVPFKNIGYFMEWGVYERNFHLFDMDWDRLTHVNYAFGLPNADGTVTLFDKKSAIESPYVDHGDPNTTDPNRAYGSFGQGIKLKHQHRGTKFGLSVGGWTFGANFSNIASTESGRRMFAQSSVGLMLDLGLDFIDIDWEYPVEGGPNIPNRPDDMKNLVSLLQAIRDEYAKLPFKAELSVASPAGPSQYRHWDFPAVCGLLDHINIMTYDMAGAWSSVTDYHSNLYSDPNHPGEPLSAHKAIQDYINGGCPSEKIVVGIPAYGRSFENSNGLYGNFSQPTKGSWPDSPGMWDYKHLPQPGVQEMFDEVTKAAYTYDPATKIFISYDSPKSFAVKLDYIKQYNLGGTMYWSGDADWKAGSTRSLITQAFEFYGRDNMAFTPNNVDYPTSKYSNIREFKAT